MEKTAEMKSGRLEAFSDGVFAIIITIMVLELKTPHETTFAALSALWPVFLSYILSFIYVGIYWNNHHHMLQVTERVSGGALWANLHLLFWLSLVPFVTSWMGEHQFQTVPVALYGVVLLGCGASYTILARILVKLHPRNSALSVAMRKDRKGWISVILYAVGIPLTFVDVRFALAFYLAVAAMWLIPDRRVEAAIAQEE